MVERGGVEWRKRERIVIGWKKIEKNKDFERRKKERKCELRTGLKDIKKSFSRKKERKKLWTEILLEENWEMKILNGQERKKERVLVEMKSILTEKEGKKERNCWLRSDKKLKEEGFELPRKKERVLVEMKRVLWPRKKGRKKERKKERKKGRKKLLAEVWLKNWKKRVLNGQERKKGDWLKLWPRKKGRKKERK